MRSRQLWRSASYSTKMKLWVYQSCVLSTLLYGCEYWLMAEHDISKLASFHTTRLRKILRIFWSRRISNDQLLKQAKQEDVLVVIIRRRWRWIGRSFRRDNTNKARIGMRWTSQGKRNRVHPKPTWRRPLERGLSELIYRWSTIEKPAGDRRGWRDFVAALCATPAG